MLYPDGMFKWKLQILLLLPALLVAALPFRSDFWTKEDPIPLLESDPVLPTPCKEITVTTTGVTCETIYGLIAHLSFPEIDLKSILAGTGYLPQAEAVFTGKEQKIGSRIYRNIVFSLEWKPVTPEFLQIYIQEYILYWGNQVPYRLFWSVRYEECSFPACVEWQSVHKAGEVHPADIQGLHPDLAADSNFNGVPAAFWNINVIP
ncbi:MAG TPA: hypothetical protein V6D48_00225 [Oculatellaceae cyanobacterium]